MKYKTTAKAVRAGYPYLIAIGYCEAQYLLQNRSPEAYSCGVCGWNFDVYNLSDIKRGLAVCTGYRNMPGVRIDYAALQIAEREASHDSTKADKLLNDLVLTVVW